MYAARRHAPCNRSEAPIISGATVRIRARGRIGLVQRQPLLGLFNAVVMELVVHLVCVQRPQQIPPDVFRKLAGVNGYPSE